MSKNKFTKRLLAIGIATVSAASIIGMAACSVDGGNGGGNEGGLTKLSTPKDLKAEAGSKKITWTGDEHASSYKVYEKKKGETSEPTAYDAPKCEYIISQIVEGTYEYYVVAIGDHTTYSDSDASEKVEYVVEAVMVTVSFNLGGSDDKDEAFKDQTFKAGGTATKPEKDPEWAGHVFTGWYSDANCTTIYKFTDPVLTTPKTIYAGWRLESDYDKLIKENDVVINEDFSETTTIANWKSYGNGAGIYKSSDTISVSNGHAVFDHAKSSSGTHKMYIDFGQATGVVKVYLEVKFDGANNSWTPLQLNGSDAKNTDKEIFGFRFDGGKIKYRLDEGSAVEPEGALAWMHNY